MLLWPIINIAFVILVGYDSDVTKSIRKLRQKRWRSMSAMTSTIDLGAIPSVQLTPNNKRPTSASQSDLEFQGRNISLNDNNDLNRDSYDLSLIHVERWKPELHSTEEQIQEQAGYNATEDRRLSLPNFVRSTASASYDTDHTLT
jgi:hypothetical protein